MGFADYKNATFYYAYNEKIYLNELDNKVIVRYKHNKNSNKAKISLASILSDKMTVWKDDSTCIFTLYVSEKDFLKGETI